MSTPIRPHNDIQKRLKGQYEAMTPADHEAMESRILALAKRKLPKPSENTIEGYWLSAYVSKHEQTREENNAVMFASISKEVSTKKTEQVLRRMLELDAVIHRDLGLADEEIFDEYNALQNEMMPLFLPVVYRLVKAGLINMCVDDEDNSESILGPEWGIVNVIPNRVYPNGNIVILGSEVTTCYPRKAKVDAAPANTGGIATP
jgi:hypothetical protein